MTTLESFVTKQNIGLQFLASGSFDWNQHEIWRISGEIRRISCEIHPKPCKSRCFNQNYPVWWMQERGYDPGFHEIWGHSPLHAPPKLKSFCWNIWLYKVVGGFHVKSARFYEIHQISWNLLDFTWNPPDFKIMSFCVMIKYRSFVFRKTKQRCRQILPLESSEITNSVHIAVMFSLHTNLSI